MRGILHDHHFDAEASRIFGGDVARDVALDAVEWELARAKDFAAYPFVANTKLGPMHYVRTKATTLHPSVIIVFTVDPYRQQVTLHDIDLARNLNLP